MTAHQRRDDDVQRRARSGDPCEQTEREADERTELAQSRQCEKLPRINRQLVE